VNATAIWLAPLAAGVLIEILGRFQPRRISTIARALAVIERQLSGRAALIVFWIFVGFHLFSRYTVQHP
jgi:hypothetical protein